MARRVGTQSSVIGLVVLFVTAASTSIQTLKFIPVQNRFHGDEVWLSVKNRAMCGAICLSLPRCGAFVWYEGQPQECLVLRDVWGPSAPLSGGTFYGATTLASGKELLHFPIPPDSMWEDILQVCLEKGLDLLQTPSTDRDVNIIAALGAVALDAMMATEDADILTHDGKEVDTSKFREEPENDFDSKPHCLMADTVSLYWIICDEYKTVAQDIVCQKP